MSRRKETYELLLSTDSLLIKLVQNEIDQEGVTQDNLARIERYLRSGLDAALTLQVLLYEEGPQ
jgi:hypothetical protein